MMKVGISFLGLGLVGLGEARMLMDQAGDSSIPKNDFCSSPVVKEKVQFPDSLAGRATIDYEMYSGYINVTSEDWLFYWFFGTADGNEDAPLVIWTNGGPGCTAMVCDLLFVLLQL